MTTEYREDVINYNDLDNQDKLFYFNENSTTTKEEILENIDWAKKDFERQASDNVDHSPKYYARLLALLEEFKVKINNTVLFNELEDWWHYGFEITEAGITLQLYHVCDVTFDDEGGITATSVDSTFDLITVKAKTLTADQYAEMYGVGVGTVRQWIRRGKLRSAMKAGSEWRIPELAEVHSRETASPLYMWEDELSDIPEEYSFLTRGNNLHIINRKTNYQIQLHTSGKDEIITMDTKEKEKFELFLISHPLITVSSRLIRAYT